MFSKNRFALLHLFFSIFLGISFIIRTVLLVKAWDLFDHTAGLLIEIYGIGLFYDAVTMLYFAAPFVVYLIVVPDKVYRGRVNRAVVYAAAFPVICLLVFDGVAEYFFFDEFHARFNFIAIDYLVYTTEVIRNIRESYPLAPLMSAVGAVSLSLFLWIRKRLSRGLEGRSTLGQRLKQGAAFLLLPLLSLAFVDASSVTIPSNSYAGELSANGIYDLFAAFRYNQIDYEAFYATRDKSALFKKLRTLLEEPNSAFVKDDIYDISRDIKNSGREKRFNVALVMVESLSADFLGAFGNKEKLTPRLDSLAQESLFFTNLYATGTRTVRGLEAVMLSVPPTPGSSIIKRPDNEGMFSWGFLMKNRGYDTNFIYGGRGYFDNMNYFFSHNGFDTIDRTDFGKNEIIFENAWGVSDEDLFAKSIAAFNKSHASGKPFFALIMTTSNHRPYTYPAGRIDIPSGTGRSGAVKYTDYAIGKFIDDARKEPWFRDTLFVIVADHCASSAGKVKLPVKKYQIPLLVYSPAHIKPQRVDRLASQMDIAPTVLGLLNFSYRSSFFGRDLLKIRPGQERAFIGTYQKLGYLKGDRLEILDVKKEADSYEFDRNSDQVKKLPEDRNLLDEAISFYQGASHLLKHRIDRWKDGNPAGRP